MRCVCGGGGRRHGWTGWCREGREGAGSQWLPASWHAPASFTARMRIDDPGHPNAYGPGKRPMHTINPAMLTKGDDVQMAFGVMGADYQPQGQVHVLPAMLEFGLDIQAALAQRLGRPSLVAMTAAGDVFAARKAADPDGGAAAWTPD